MIEVSKTIGKMLKQKVPNLCVKTSHGRHYYAAETYQVQKLIQSFNDSEVVSVYPNRDERDD